MNKQSNYLKSFLYFYSYLGYRVFVSMLISLFVGFLDGVGLTMFFPLLQYSSSDSVSGGDFSFINKVFNFLGVPLSLNSILLLILFIFILKGVIKFIGSLYNVYIRQMFIVKLRTDCVNLLRDYSFSSFVRADSGRIQNTLSGEVTKVLMSYIYYFQTIQNAVLILVYVFFAFVSDAQSTIFVGMGGLIINLILKKLNNKTKVLSKSITEQGHVYQLLLIQAVSLFKYLKSTASFDLYSKKIIDVIKNLENENKKIQVIQSLIDSIKEPLVIIIIIALIYVEITFFNQTLSLLLLSLLFFYRALNYLMMAQSTWSLFLSNFGSLQNISEFMEELEKNHENYGKKNFDKLKHKISLRNVTFGYVRSSKTLNNINLVIEKNTTVAFVGESGSGKTTLANLIAGILNPESGVISVDGVSFSEIDIRTYQKKIGYITQEPVIFGDTIFNNVTLWAEPTKENVAAFWRAIKQASILDFVKSLPSQEKEYLGNNGILVSGGQKQRLSIARELYKQIDILILDEATSALDSETEKTIQKSIDLLKGKCTIIIIAHRLSTIKNADKIVLMNKGEVAAEGNFEFLLKTNKMFYKMVELQEL